MSRFVKFVLIWLVIAALPIQGIAASMKAACGPEHHETIAANASDVEDVHAAMHSHEEASGHSQHMLTASDSGSSSDHPSSQSHKSSFCSSCAACCVGAVAPPVTLTQPTPPFVSETVHIAAAPLVAGVIPTGLERPPRHFST